MYGQKYSRLQFCALGTQYTLFTIQGLKFITQALPCLLHSLSSFSFVVVNAYVQSMCIKIVSSSPVVCFAKLVETRFSKGWDTLLSLCPGKKKILVADKLLCTMMSQDKITFSKETKKQEKDILKHERRF